MSALKTVKYRGGIVEFVIPIQWQEEYEPRGGATFYEDTLESGTFRLNVLGFDSKNTPAQQMAETAFRDGTIERTLSGFPLRREEKTVAEHDEMLHIIR